MVNSLDPTCNTTPEPMTPGSTTPNPTPLEISAAELTVPQNTSAASAKDIASDWEPKILVFACQYCTYAGADLAGLSRLQYPTTTRVLRVPCSGRTNPQFVIRAFQKGFDGVLVAGCHPGDCHFTTGNYFTRRRYLLMTRLMEFIGLDPRRFRVCWISGSEGPKFQQVVTELTDTIRPLGPSQKLWDEGGISS